jgi:hypothetical protein
MFSEACARNVLPVCTSTIAAVTKCSTEPCKGQAFDIILDVVVIIMALANSLRVSCP